MHGTDAKGDALTFVLSGIDPSSGDLLGSGSQLSSTGQVIAAGAVDLGALSIVQTAPLFISVLGSLTAVAGTNAFLQEVAGAKGETGSLTIASVSAGGAVQITAPDGILSAGTSAVQVATGTNQTLSGDLTLNAGTGDLAGADTPSVTPLVIDVGGAAGSHLSSASAGGHLSLQQSSGDLWRSTR